MIRTVAIGAMIGAVGALAGSALSGEITVTFFFLCLLAFVAAEATARFTELRQHQRNMAELRDIEADLQARSFELEPRFARAEQALSILHGGRLQ